MRLLPKANGGRRILENGATHTRPVNLQTAIARMARRHVAERGHVRHARHHVGAGRAPPAAQVLTSRMNSGFKSVVNPRVS